MSGVQAAQGAICCCKTIPFAPCEYWEAREWYLSNPTAFPSISANVSATETESRYLVNPPNTQCGLCFGKESNENWNAGGATLLRVPVAPQFGLFPIFARWQSSWMPAGSITQMPGTCSTTLNCCGGCCNDIEGPSDYDLPPDCIPNAQQPFWLCQFYGGYCSCVKPYTYPMPARYYYGCGNEQYQVPSPCAACSSRTTENVITLRAPTSTALFYRIIVEIGGWQGATCNPFLPGCPPPFISGTYWQLSIERGTRNFCGSGNDPIFGNRIIAWWGRTCCNYRAGPAGTYRICISLQSPSGSSSNVEGCDGRTWTWQYGLTASVT